MLKQFLLDKIIIKKIRTLKTMMEKIEFHISFLMECFVYMHSVCITFMGL